MNDRSDKKLVIASRSGDKEAYAILVNTYYRQVFFICLGILGNVHDAEEITQDTMLKGFMEIKKLRNYSRFSPWINRIAKNLCINLIRRNKHAKNIIKQKANQPDQPSCENDNLQIAIEKLPKELRLPLLLYYYENQSVKNVAELLDISTAGVYLKLRAATKQLRELMIQGDAK